MNKLLTRLAEQAHKEEVYPSKLFPPSIYYRFFKLLAEELKPKLSVELGVCGGGGSLHLAIGHRKGTVIGVDFQWDHPESVDYILTKYKNFKFILGDSVLAAKTVFKDHGKTDILFIDTTHTEEQTLKEFNAWKPYLSKKAVVCFDDLFRPGMEEAWNKIPGTKLRFDYLHQGQYPEGGGFGVAYNIFKKKY